MTFADALLSKRYRKTQNDFLNQIDMLIDWHPIRTLINKKYTIFHSLLPPLSFPTFMRRTPLSFISLFFKGLKRYTKTLNSVGNPTYNALMMFKNLLLQIWYVLSVYEVEERINEVFLFLSLYMGIIAPDHSTISCFRLELIRLGIGQIFVEAEQIV